MILISQKQKSIRQTLSQLLTDYKLDEVELNVLLYVQSIILENKLNDKRRIIKI